MNTLLRTVLALILIATFFLPTANSQVRTFNYEPQQKIDPSKIDIVRDKFGVPHIFAETDAEVAYGLQWATAEDDMENLQFMMMAIKGYLGFKNGVEGAKIDYAVQLMGLHNFVAEHYETDVSPEFKLVLEGACQGSNAYAAAHSEELWYKKAFPITPQEVLVGYMLAQSLMGGVDGAIKDILNGNVLKHLPKEINDPMQGSNAYAFNSQLTDHGNTYHVINAHQPIDGLLSWYEAHVHSEQGWNITGGLFHGGVSVFHGTTPTISWAHTTGDLDLKDTYKLNMHPKKKKWYKYDGEWHKLETKRAKLRVGLGKNKKFRIRIKKKFWWSKYGPTLMTDHGVFALRMPAFFEIKTAEQWYRMNKATNYSEFRRALDIQGISMQNVTYADKNDTIFFLANGKVPKRDPNYDWKKVLPGDTSATLWSEYLPESELAQNLNPDCGYVYNTNNSIYNNTCEDEVCDPSTFPISIGYESDKRTNRGYRSKEILEQISHIDYEGVKRLKFDMTFPDSLIFMKKYPIKEIFSYKPEDHPELADVIKKFNRWNFVGDTNDIDAGIIYTTLYLMHNDESVSVQDLRDNDSLRVAFVLANMRKAKDRLIKHFGAIDIPLGKIQVLSRGDREFGLMGGPDMIRAVYCTLRDDGKLPMYAGDGLVQIVKFTKDGPEIESINSYGASNKPDSPHYTDQMQLFAEHKMKKMSLDKEEIYKNAERIYHPMAKQD